MVRTGIRGIRIVLVGGHGIAAVRRRDHESSFDRLGNFAVETNATAFHATPWTSPDVVMVIRHQVPAVSADHVATGPCLARVDGVNEPANWALTEGLTIPIIVLQLIRIYKRDDPTTELLLLLVVAVVELDVPPQRPYEVGIGMVYYRGLSEVVRLVDVGQSSARDPPVANLWVTDCFQSVAPPF